MKITVDGNIGSGKTTQISLLKSAGYSVHPEPLYEWPLNLFYSDKNRWAFTMQMAVLSGFSKQADIYERSPDSSLEIFWKYMKDNNIVNATEDYVCKNMYERYGWKSDVFIYIDTPPEICYNRVVMRFQDGDSKIDSKYLRTLHEYYMTYIKSHPCAYVIDGTKSPDEVHKQIISIIKECVMV